MPHIYKGILWPLFQEPSRKLRVKGFKQLQGNIRPIAKPIAEAVPKLVKRIQHDTVHFDTPEAFQHDADLLFEGELAVGNAFDIPNESFCFFAPGLSYLLFSYRAIITCREESVSHIQVLCPS